MASIEFVDFYKRLFPELFGSLTLYCGDPLVAEELTQEAFARVLVRWEKVRRMNSPEAWVHRVGVNLVNSYFRGRKAEKAVARRLAAGLTEGIEDSEAAIAMRDAVSRLPKRSREALILRHYVGLSVSDAAFAMDCSERTTKRLTQKATDQLRVELGMIEIEMEGSDVQ